MSVSAGGIAWQLAMEISPILLVGGIASRLGGILPIIAFTEGANLLVSLVQSGGGISLNNSFARFKVLPGSTPVNFQVSTMPFANQNVAGNALISQANYVSYRMVCPAGPNSGGSALRLLTMMSLQSSLKQHALSGGLFTCITPSAIMSNCLFLRMTDISADAENTQPQNEWQLDFYQPLVTLQQAQKAQSALIQALSNGVPTSSALSGLLTGGLTSPSALAGGNPFAQ